MNLGRCDVVWCGSREGAEESMGVGASGYAQKTTEKSGKGGTK